LRSKIGLQQIGKKPDLKKRRKKPKGLRSAKEMMKSSLNLRDFWKKVKSLYKSRPKP